MTHLQRQQFLFTKTNGWAVHGHVITKFSGMGRFTSPWCSANIYDQLLMFMIKSQVANINTIHHHSHIFLKKKKKKHPAAWKTFFFFISSALKVLFSTYSDTYRVSTRKVLQNSTCASRYLRAKA